MDPIILVTGGTGRLGRLVVSGLIHAGRDVRVLSRHNLLPADGIRHVSCDLRDAEGIEAALDGATTIVHCAGSRKGDEETTSNLVRAAVRTGVQHLVYISVVGADRIPVQSAMDRTMFGYFQSKRAAELVVAESGLPWTTVRATQFHDAFLATAKAMAKLPVLMAAAGFRFQPIDEGEVAARLVGAALAGPAGAVSDMAGPRVYSMGDLLRSYLRASGKHRLIVPVPMFGEAAAAVRAGALLSPDRAVGQRTWEDFLAARVGAPAASRSVA